MFDDFHVFLVGTGIGKPRIYAFSSRFSFADVLFTRNPVGWLGIPYYPIICHIYIFPYMFSHVKNTAEVWFTLKASVYMVNVVFGHSADSEDELLIPEDPAKTAQVLGLMHHGNRLEFDK